MALLDGLDQVLSSIVDTGDDICITLSVGSPENDDFIQVVLRFEGSDRKVSIAPHASDDVTIGESLAYLMSVLICST